MQYGNIIIRINDFTIKYRNLHVILLDHSVSKVLLFIYKYTFYTMRYNEESAIFNKFSGNVVNIRFQD